MKVLFVIDSLAGGGAEKLLSDLLPFNEKKIETCVLSLSNLNDKYSEKLISKGVEVVFAPYFKIKIKYIFYIKNFVETGEYDVVHANLFPATYYCSIAKKFSFGKFPKLLMTEHSTDNKRRHFALFRPIEKWIYASYNKIICISEPVRVALINWLRDNRNSRFIVINNGIDIKTFAEAKPYERDVLSKKIATSDILLCIIGSIKPLKNHKLMIEIMRELPDKYKLLIVGEGPLKQEIENLVNDYHITDRVEFLGFRNDIPSIIAASDIIVVPSKWEGFGLVAVEAMACGIPVIISDVPGLLDVVGNGGLHASSKEGFVDAILSLEQNDKYIEYVCRARLESNKYDIKNTRESYINTFIGAVSPNAN